MGVPVGKTLDINYINNNTKKETQELNNYGYQRGQGVGSWEINLAAFFRELNPLQWESEDYIYYSDENTYNRGLAFSDALEVLKYRYKDDYDNLAALSDETWIPRQSAYDRMGQLIFKGHDLNIDRANVLDRFKYDLADTYSDGPLQLTAYRTGSSSADWDAWDNEDRSRLDDHWAGSDNPRKFFDIQELVDDSKFSQDMVARLQGTYKNKAFTDQQHYLTNDVAFYRLLSQLSADSVYTADDRIPLNYTTVASPGYTNFIPWTANALTASNFFQITANRLLQQQFSKNLNEVQIYPTNQYTAGVHQLLQLTANIYDAMTNQAPSSGRGPALPSVFRPIYRVERGRVYLDSYEMVTNNVDELLDKDTFVKIVPTISGAGDSVRHPNVTVSTFQGYTDTDGKIRMNLIGMPWIIAARKGYPNFNEQEVLTDIQLTRKIGLTRRNVGAIFNVQDMWVQYILSISNRLAFEGWNSYLDQQYEFKRPLKLYMTNQVTTALWKNGNVIKVSTATNNYGVPTRYSNYVSRILSTNITANDLRTWEEGTFKTMTSSNLVFVPSSIIETHQSGGATYSTNSGIVTLEPKNPATFYQGANFLAGGPLYMTMTNRITYIAIDAENNWLVDYVNIEKTNLFNITGLIQGNTVMSGTDSGDNGLNRMLWDPNYGIQRQIEISLGNVDDQDTWVEYGGGYQNERAYQIQGFRQFCGLTNSLTASGMPDQQGAYRQTPYNPTVHKLIIESLQANDPLVHYHLGDLVNFTNVFTPLRANQENTQEDPSNIGLINTFYVPWGGNPDKDITGYRESVNQVGVNVQQGLDVMRERVQRGGHGEAFRHGAAVIRIDQGHARHDLFVRDQAFDPGRAVHDVRVRRDLGTGARGGRDGHDALEILPRELRAQHVGSEELGDVHVGLIRRPGGLRRVHHAAAADGDHVGRRALADGGHDPADVVEVGFRRHVAHDARFEVAAEDHFREVGASSRFRVGLAADHERRGGVLLLFEQEIRAEVVHDPAPEVDADRLVVLEERHVVGDGVVRAHVHLATMLTRRPGTAMTFTTVLPARAAATAGSSSATFCISSAVSEAGIMMRAFGLPQTCTRISCCSTCRCDSSTSGHFARETGASLPRPSHISSAICGA